jgi:hypothetical protein
MPGGISSGSEKRATEFYPWVPEDGLYSTYSFVHLKSSQNQKKNIFRQFWNSVLLLLTIMYCISVTRGALRGLFIFPRGGVTVVQGTVRALFYTNFTRKKGHFTVFTGGVHPNTPLNPPLHTVSMIEHNPVTVIQPILVYMLIWFFPLEKVIFMYE